MTSASEEKWRPFNSFFLSQAGLRTYQHPCTLTRHYKRKTCHFVTVDAWSSQNNKSHERQRNLVMSPWKKLKTATYRLRKFLARLCGIPTLLTAIVNNWQSCGQLSERTGYEGRSMRSSGYGRAALPATWYIPENVIDDHLPAEPVPALRRTLHQLLITWALRRTRFTAGGTNWTKTASTVDSSVVYICFGKIRFSDTVSATGRQFCLA